MTSKRWMVRVASGLALVGSAGLFGCSASVTASQVPATAVSGTAVDDDLTADLNDHHRHHHQGGVAMFIALSLDTLGLPAEQQAAITKLQAELYAKMEPARAAGQSVLTTLADGVAAGAIDKLKVDAAIANLEIASGLVHESTVDVVNRLHAALTPLQRATLVDKIMAHWSVYQQANIPDAPAGKDHPMAHLVELAMELGLTADQIAKISDSFHAGASAGGLDRALVDAHMQRLAAFRDEAFDARTLEGGRAVAAHLAARGAARMARFYEAVDPALTPEQRAKLATMLREHATHNDAAVAAH